MRWVVEIGRGRLKIPKYFQTVFFYSDSLYSICRMLLFSAFYLFFS
ncbi:hypothetical protein NEISUBOT_03234 [Neisseria subflava NJ9703]|uniref:Uncharacterized protein n=1 Tax=Neisseria subflava NJ9703 TaxID=546268 RepID=A0A9W5IT05_NEISU|nr:hypothetical protein NEISUBOT_03234 [Neisseria subflava NJ9703]